MRGLGGSSTWYRASQAQHTARDRCAPGWAVRTRDTLTVDEEEDGSDHGEDVVQVGARVLGVVQAVQGLPDEVHSNDDTKGRSSL